MERINLMLVVLIAVQQIFYMHQIQKLVDKAMCKDFSDYRRAIKPKEKVRIQLSDNDPIEDLGALQGIGA